MVLDLNAPSPIQLSVSSCEDTATPSSGVDEDESTADGERLQPKHNTGKRLKNRKKQHAKDEEDNRHEELTELLKEKWAEDKATREEFKGQQERMIVAVESLVSHLINSSANSQS